MPCGSPVGSQKRGEPEQKDRAKCRVCFQAGPFGIGLTGHVPFDVALAAGPSVCELAAVSSQGLAPNRPNSSEFKHVALWYLLN